MTTRPAHDNPQPPLRALALETTRRCSLACRHCRARANEAREESDGTEELSTEEFLRFFDDLATFFRGTLILTGGDPLARDDILTIVSHAAGSDLRTVAALCGPKANHASMRDLVTAGITGFSFSLDAHTTETHNEFRGHADAYAWLTASCRAAKELGAPFQINTTVHRDNAAHLPQIAALAQTLGASAWDLFFFVPCGRGEEHRELMLDTNCYRQALDWINTHASAATGGLPVQVTCAPQMARLAAHGDGSVRGRGCLGGTGFGFVSATGEVQICGFLPVSAGNIRTAPFSRIWEESAVLTRLRQRDQLEGVCRACGWGATCGGCRARAFAAEGHMLAADPYCAGGLFGSDSAEPTND